eukprot:2192205-Rhodomonas_salina.2
MAGTRRSCAPSTSMGGARIYSTSHADGSTSLWVRYPICRRMCSTELSMLCCGYAVLSQHIMLRIFSTERAYGATRGSGRAFAREKHLQSRSAVYQVLIYPEIKDEIPDLAQNQAIGAVSGTDLGYAATRFFLRTHLLVAASQLSGTRNPLFGYAPTLPLRMSGTDLAH